MILWLVQTACEVAIIVGIVVAVVWVSGGCDGHALRASGLLRRDIARQQDRRM